MKTHPFLTVHSHLQEAHDHLHKLCMGGREAGREISKAHLDKLGLAHDHMAAAIGLSCRYHSDDYPSGQDFKNAPASQNAPKRSGAKPGADYKAREGLGIVSMREYSDEEDSAVKLLEGLGYQIRW